MTELPRSAPSRKPLTWLATGAALAVAAFLVIRLAAGPRLAYKVENGAALLPPEGLELAVEVRDVRGALLALGRSHAFQAAEAKPALAGELDGLFGGAGAKVRGLVHQPPRRLAASLAGDGAAGYYGGERALLAVKVTRAARAALKGGLAGMKLQAGPLPNTWEARGRERPVYVMLAGDYLLATSDSALLAAAHAQAFAPAPAAAAAALAAAILKDGEAAGARLAGGPLAGANVTSLDLGVRAEANALRVRVAYALAKPVRAPGTPAEDRVAAGFSAATPLYVAVNDGPFFWENHAGPRAEGLRRVLADLPADAQRALAQAAPRFSLALTGLVERGPGTSPSPAVAVALQGESAPLHAGLEALLSRTVSDGFSPQSESAFARPVSYFASGDTAFRPGVAALPGGAALALDLDALRAFAAVASGSAKALSPHSGAPSLALHGDGPALTALARRLLLGEANRLSTARQKLLSDDVVPALAQLPALEALDGALTASPTGAAGEVVATFAP